jgi:hypothetical protein
MPDFGEPEYRCLTSDRTWATEPGRLSLLPEHHTNHAAIFYVLPGPWFMSNFDEQEDQFLDFRQDNIDNEITDLKIIQFKQTKS